VFAIFDPRYTLPRLAAIELDKAGSLWYDTSMFDGFVGQKRACALLCESILYAKHMGRLPHLLLWSGTGGTGKSTLARAVAAEMSADIVTINTLDARPSQILTCLASYMGSKPLVIFLEEWNHPNKPLDAFLRPAMEEDRYLYDGLEYYLPNAKQISFIIASNNKSVLPQPLLSRMDCIQMAEYSHDELDEIAHQHASKINLSITYQALLEIVNRSKGIPRTIIRALDACLRHLVAHNILEIGYDRVCSVLESLDLYYGGVDLLDIKILRLLVEHEALSLTALCGMLNETPETIRYQEGYLIKCGYMQITNKRRVLPAAHELLDSIGSVL
jgi:Holliday junction DNA helicase RuvB